MFLTGKHLLKTIFKPNNEKFVLNLNFRIFATRKMFFFSCFQLENIYYKLFLNRIMNNLY
jgi:hypothetical protein